jgi:hypothetical protein
LFITLVEKTGSLAPQVQRASPRVILIQVPRPPGKRNGTFHEGPQFLGLGQRSHDAILARVDQRSRQVAQHRVPMLAGTAEFPMCL